MKKLFVVGLLSLASLAILSAKTYTITVSNPTKVGSVQLKAGQYKVKVDGSNAIFTDVNNQKTVTTPVKVEEGATKVDSTRVQSTRDGDTDRIQEIDLEGSKTKLTF
jgi:hypothetical protein